jgi:DNA-binding MarR family transcriptional regulator
VDEERGETGSQGDGLAWAVHELAVVIAETDVAVGAALRVSPGDYLALKHVMLHPHDLGPVELGRLVGISSGSATALVDRLVRAGHMVRLPHPGDRRRRVLAVSEQSHRRVLRELDRWATVLEEVARDYSHSDRTMITTFVRALAARHRGLARLPPALP